PRGLKRNECKTRSGYGSLLLWPLRGLRDLLLARNQTFEMQHVVIRHSRSRKALLKNFATPFSAQLRHPSNGCYGILRSFHNEACVTLLHYFGNRAVAIGYDRRAARHRLNHHQPERLRPVDRKEQRICIAEEFIFLPLPNLTNEFHERTT